MKTDNPSLFMPAAEYAKMAAKCSNNWNEEATKIIMLWTFGKFLFFKLFKAIHKCCTQIKFAFDFVQL